MPIEEHLTNFPSKEIKPTLEVTIQPRQNESWQVAAVLKSSGEGQLPKWAFGVLDLGNSWKQLLREYAFDPKEYGKLLGGALFGKELSQLFIGSLRESAHIRFFLIVEDIELRSINWERAHYPDETGGWVSFAQDQRVLFSIYDRAKIERYYPRFTQKNLKTLVVINSPESEHQDVLGNEFKPFETAKLADDLTRMYENLPAKEAKLSVLHKSGVNTWNALTTQLNESHPHILHIVCHGCFFEDGIGSVLVFQEENKKLQAITVKRFIDDLKPISPLPHLIFLSSCDTANPQATTDVYSQFAQAIRTELGTPAVVAMSGKVSQAVANIISKQFYPHLLRDPQVDIALSRAAFEINKTDPSRFMPVLRQRLGSEVLFGLSRWDLEELNETQIEEGVNHLKLLMPIRAPAHNGKFNALTDNLIQVNLQELDQFCHEVTEVGFATLAQDPESKPHYDNRCPFPGMRAFRKSGDEDFRKFFFGRDKEIREVVEKVESEFIVAIVGSSGSGKSSLAFAGVLPTLEKKGWELLGVDGEGIRLQVSKRRTLVTQLTNALKSIDTKSKAVLYIDQFEQVYIGSDAHQVKQRKELFSKLLSLPEIYPQLRVLITIRADYALEDAKKDLGEFVTKTRYDLDVFSTQQLRSLAEQQVASVGLEFEEGLAHRIQSEVIEGQRGVLSLLQYLLWQLWQRRLGKTLRTEDYESLKGIKDVVTTIADRLFDKYAAHDGTPDEYREAQSYLKNIFLRLTSPDKERKNTFDRHYKDIKQSVDKKSLYPTQGAKPVIDELLFDLSNERLISVYSDEKGENQTVEIVHESLIQHWGKLNLWLGDAGLNSVRQSLMEASSVWDSITAKGEKRDALVHRGTRLLDIKNYEAKQLLYLNQLEKAYLEACLIEDKRRARQQRNERFFGFSMFGLFIISGLVSWAAMSQKTESADRLATSYFGRGVTLRDDQLTQYSQAAAYYSKAADAAGSQTAKRRYALALKYINEDMPLLFQTFDGLHESKLLQNPKLSADGKLLMTFDEGGVAGVWDVEKGKLKTSIKHPLDKRKFWPAKAKLIAGGALLLTWDGKEARMWDATNGELKRVFVKYEGIGEFELFANGTRLFTWGDNRAQIWEVTKDGVNKKAILNEEIVGNVKLFASQNRLVSWHNREVRVWDISSLQELDESPINYAEGSVPIIDGDRRVLFKSSNGILKVLDSASGRLKIFKLDQSLDEFKGFKFFEDGKRVLIWNSKTIKILDSEAVGRKNLDLKFDGDIEGVILTPDEKIIMAMDSTDFKIWDIDTAELIIETKTDFKKTRFRFEQNAIPFKDNIRFLTWNRNDTRILSLKSKAEPDIWGPYMVNEGVILEAVLFARDSRVLTLGDKEVRIWDADSGDLIGQPMLHKFGVTKVAFFDNKLLTVGRGGSVRIWAIIAPKPDSKSNGKTESNTSQLSLEQWALERYFKINQIDDPKEHISAIGRLDSSRILVGSFSDQTLQVLDLNTGTILFKYPFQHTREIVGMRLSAQNTKVVSWTGNGASEVYISSTETGEALGHKPINHGANSQIHKVSFFAHDSQLLSWGDREVRIWDAASGAFVKAFSIEDTVWGDTSEELGMGEIGHVKRAERNIEGAKLLADDKKLLIWSGNGIARIFDVASEELSGPAMEHGGQIDEVIIFDEDKQLLTIGSNVTRVWSLETGELLAVRNKKVDSALFTDNDSQAFVAHQKVHRDEYNYELRQALSSGFYFNKMNQIQFLSNQQIKQCKEELRPFENCQNSTELWCRINRQALWPFMQTWGLLPKIEVCAS